MRISDLYNKHLGEDIYVVGTGPTLRMLPKGFFNNKIAIGLNQAYKTFDLTYAVTVHPELISLASSQGPWQLQLCAVVQKISDAAGDR